MSELRKGTIRTPPAVPTGTPTVSMSFQAKTTPSSSVRSDSRLGMNPAIAASGTARAVPKHQVGAQGEGRGDQQPQPEVGVAGSDGQAQDDAAESGNQVIRVAAEAEAEPEDTQPEQNGEGTAVEQKMPQRPAVGESGPSRPRDRTAGGRPERSERFGRTDDGGGDRWPHSCGSLSQDGGKVGEVTDA